MPAGHRLFKFRGAYNKIKSALEAGKAPGVVAFSSGNHAQGVAAAASLLGVPSIIVMPEDAPRIKIENTKALGGEVKLYDRYKEDREAIAARSRATRATWWSRPMTIPPSSRARAPSASRSPRTSPGWISPDVVLAPCSSGGLISGIATAVKTRYPEHGSLLRAGALR